MALLAGRVLYQRLRQERPLWRKGRDALLREAGRLFGARYIGRKLLVLAVAALALFAALAHGPYRVGASATVQGVVQRVVAAPFEGYIAEATRRAGDEVRQGDVLAVLDTRETELELLRAGNLEVQYRRQGRGHGARRQRRRRHRPGAGAPGHGPDPVLPAADPAFQPARAVRRRAGRNDLSQQLGEAVKRGQELFKLSPLDGYRLWLDVEDRQIDDVAVGQTGRVALAAMPDRQIPSRSRASCRWPRSRKARRCSAWRPA